MIEGIVMGIIFWSLVLAFSSANTKKQTQLDVNEEIRRKDGEVKEQKRKAQNISLPPITDLCYPKILISNATTTSSSKEHKDETKIFYDLQGLPTVKVNYNKMGISESYFYKCMQKFFDKNKLSSHTRSIGGQIPDIIYEDVFKNVFLIIEIDEPYVLENNKPIHFIGEDESSERYYLHNGWSIIRFSEMQVVAQPQSCCKVISQVIDYLSLENNTIINEKLSKVRDPFTVRCWTKGGAIKMAENGSRKSYLKQRGLIK